MQPLNTLGIIGGMSPASTTIYYEMINRLVNERLGGNASAPMLIYSVNFEEIAEYQRAGDWASAGQVLAQAGKVLQDAGAKGILLATNTMHKVADDIIASLSIPFLHIADATATAILAQGMDKVALLGTSFTMSQAFYRERLASHGIECFVPSTDEQADIHRIIFDELTLNKVIPASKQRYLDIIANLQAQGARGVILGCTEIGLLISQADSELVIFDTALIHAQAGADFVLANHH